MRANLIKLLAGAFALTSLGVVTSISTASATVHPAVTVKYLKLSMAKAYTPTAKNGGTDDYHCSLINPRVTANSYIVSSNFNPGDNGATEVHHAILFMIPPSWAKQATKANNNGKGWTCFGETVLSGAQVHIPGTNPSGGPTWLTGWAPGHNLSVTPKGTGVYFPKGSLVVLQIHYNMLVSRKAIKSTLTLGTVPAATKLKPLGLDLFPAPPEVPCLAKWNPATTPLCSRANSLAYLGQRFGQGAVNFVNTLDSVCGDTKANNYNAGDTTSCTWTYYRKTNIIQIGAHMHLTGSTFKVVLDPGTAKEKTLVNVPSFNFDYQRSYTMATPIAIVPGDKVRVTCSYNPLVHDVNPQLRDAPRRYVTWGDGSSDEMCLALINTVQ